MNFKQLSFQPTDPEFDLFQRFPLEQKLSTHSEQLVNEHLLSCHLMLKGDQVLGRFALYVNQALKYKGFPAICIGAYACIVNEKVADHLLQWALNLCAELGYDYCLGPMNGSTWYPYRFSTQATVNPFAMDLVNPLYYNKQFKDAGFKSVAKYNSSVEKGKVSDHKSETDFEEHFNSKGIKVRNLDLENLEEELTKLGQFSNEAFQDNFLFTPIKIEKFISNYSRLKRYMDADFILIAENNKREICSMIFALKDPQDCTDKTLIMKTIAARKDYKYRGLTTFLSLRLMDQARTKGYNRFIHALMHEGNSSLRTSLKSGTTINQYALYGKKI